MISAKDQGKAATREKRFFLLTQGCKVNQYESRALSEAWLAHGWKQAARPEEAEILLLNTCAVTERAVAEARNLARRLRRAAPEAALLLTGCAAEALPQEFKSLPCELVGRKRKAALAGLPLAPFTGRPFPDEEQAKDSF
ncbi:MAG: tRNA (N6-isopentenyl adenosine(37)-C2)-methylthiotransferase MiaB, partial [Deltaproteobacteria bacterium]|nr:tRNA (N6-isopentenyl adenosine(37)-C2)-methylthiotransferase MiaB [Deltaproteobacteria bacterium]